MADNKKARVDYLDIAKAIGMFLVLIGHTVASDTSIKNVIYSFHMPLFFILSGMVLKEHSYSFKGEIREFLKKKAFALIVPYLLWGLIYSPFSFRNLVYIVYGTRETLINANSLTSLWFLPVMFLSVVLAEGIVSYAVKVNKRWIVSIGCILTFTIGALFPHWQRFGNPWGIDIAFVSIGFLLLGYYLRRLITKLNDKLSIVFGMLVIALVGFALLVHYSTSSVGYVLMANAIYGNFFIFLGNAVLGSLIVILLSCLISKRRFHKTVMLYAGQNTLGIFVVHKPIVEYGRIIAERIGLSYNNLIVAVGISIIAMAGTLIVVYITSLVLPEIFGKKKH